jgi:hypothetical protein
MEQRAGVVQRAFEIAKSGKVASISALRAQLTEENYLNNAQFLAGRSLKNQLVRIIIEARTAK